MSRPFGKPAMTVSAPAASAAACTAASPSGRGWPRVMFSRAAGGQRL
ncbi:hypothetical protein [Streptomyces sp. CNQ-509]|nr:hypothetical protein [Streptomyces sp. CNQ-509]